MQSQICCRERFVAQFKHINRVSGQNDTSIVQLSDCVCAIITRVDGSSRGVNSHLGGWASQSLRDIIRNGGVSSGSEPSEAEIVTILTKLRLLNLVKTWVV